MSWHICLGPRQNKNGGSNWSETETVSSACGPSDRHQTLGVLPDLIGHRSFRGGSERWEKRATRETHQNIAAWKSETLTSSIKGYQRHLKACSPRLLSWKLVTVNIVNATRDLIQDYKQSSFCIGLLARAGFHHGHLTSIDSSLQSIGHINHFPQSSRQRQHICITVALIC